MLHSNKIMIINWNKTQLRLTSIDFLTGSLTAALVASHVNFSGLYNTKDTFATAISPSNLNKNWLTVFFPDYLKWRYPEIHKHREASYHIISNSWGCVQQLLDLQGVCHRSQSLIGKGFSAWHSLILTSDTRPNLSHVTGLILVATLLY